MLKTKSISTENIWVGEMKLYVQEYKQMLIYEECQK